MPIIQALEMLRQEDSLKLENILDEQSDAGLGAYAKSAVFKEAQESRKPEVLVVPVVPFMQ